MSDDDRLRRLLSDAVCDIEPADRIDQLRASVHPSPRVVPMARSRSWYAATGIVATAAVIGVIAYLTSVVGDKSPGIGPAGNGGTALPTMTASDPAGPGDTSRPKLVDLPIYYLGHSPRGDVLYRQDTPVSAGLEPLRAAVTRLMATPFDHDYRLGWSPGWLTSAELSDGVIRVDLGRAPLARPASMSARMAYVVVQSAVYTLRAASHSGADVLFVRGGLPVASVLGVPTGHPVAPGGAADLLSRIDISRPAVDGMHPRGTRLVLTGTDAAPLDRVVVRLVRSGGAGSDKTLRTQTALSAGAPDASGRYRWRVVVDIAGVSPGSYTVVARNGGHHVDTDTRVVVLRPGR
ncbi:MAG TPA: hypothetical protein VHW64_11250 [Nocardioides sp.]|jgi:hypothetical protein|uniref:hypothetical protein n=1 Tax=Nocardioides sp. TaxID=35761 RepID=UPI002E31D918|nr:hypothetical protein [Nocardioides sp.]HEX3931277.1 hypothetical protein [Nocardioides sp.]